MACSGWAGSRGAWWPALHTRSIGAKGCQNVKQFTGGAGLRAGRPAPRAGSELPAGTSGRARARDAPRRPRAAPATGGAEVLERHRVPGRPEGQAPADLQDDRDGVVRDMDQDRADRRPGAGEDDAKHGGDGEGAQDLQMRDREDQRGKESGGPSSGSLGRKSLRIAPAPESKQSCNRGLLWPRRDGKSTIGSQVDAIGEDHGTLMVVLLAFRKVNACVSDLDRFGPGSRPVDDCRRVLLILIM